MSAISTRSGNRSNPSGNTLNWRCVTAYKAGLSLEFTIGGDGQLEQLRLMRSSGSQLLDEEAIRAIKAAAPFPPIPSWIRPNPLPISASMEYHDNRLNYSTLCALNIAIVLPVD